MSTYLPNEHSDEIIIYGTTWCPDCKRAKQFFGEQRIPYFNIDIEQHPEGLALIEQLNQGKRIIPTIVFPDGSILAEPSNAQLAEKLGLQTHAKRSFYDDDHYRRWTHRADCCALSGPRRTGYTGD